MKEISNDKYWNLLRGLQKAAKALRHKVEDKHTRRTFTSTFLSSSSFYDKMHKTGVVHFSALGCEHKDFTNKKCICIRHASNHCYLDTHFPGDCKWYIDKKKCKWYK